MTNSDCLGFGLALIDTSLSCSPRAQPGSVAAKPTPSQGFRRNSRGRHALSVGFPTPGKEQRRSWGKWGKLFIRWRDEPTGEFSTQERTDVGLRWLVAAGSLLRYQPPIVFFAPVEAGRRQVHENCLGWASDLDP